MLNSDDDIISRVLEEYSTRPSKLKAPGNYHKDSTEDIRTHPKKTAQALNSSARRTLEAVQREWDVINQDMQKLGMSPLFFSDCPSRLKRTDIKHRTKKQELEKARKVLFLLNILEKREEVRVRRVIDVGSLVDALRYARIPLKRFDFISFLRKEADLAMRNLSAASSDGLMDREGEKTSTGEARYYRHTMETLAVS